MVVKKTAEKKSASAESTGAAAGKKTAVTETAVKKAAKKAAVKRAVVKKVAEKKVPARKAPAGKDAEKKTAARKKAVPAAHVGAGHTAPAKKTAAKKTAAKKAAAAAMVAAEAAEQTGAHTVVAKKSAARTRTAGKGAAPVPPARGVVTTAPGELAVRPGEDPWTPQEVEEARALLSSEITRLRSELEAAGAALAGLMRDSGDGAGDDEADTGTKNITREHEMSLAANAQEMLDQTERALARLDAGTYGLCEVCGNPIGKARMQAFPRATLCVEDKQKQERRG
ncbi:TraR/DksA C4-type zinc finger protein [Streptomyces sp. NBC_01321]|uniref:TraR/DksA family transcriptional regulator n=1 Tax=unclassified Streptomyces TaxID=2593676 RepID=UPI002E151EA3|nr:TraR/DksA C4-type zinc finger protein [Streptomyces sp. NBC_01321]WSP54577.1 TraR/DksA C4-type zinc finger protein [Streptomyces sp. NBC_01241]